MTEHKKRTPTQNDALHKLFELYADALNDGGFDQMAVLEKKAMPVDNTPESLKEIWKAAQKAMYPPPEGEKVSTTALKTDQVNKVYRVIDRFFSEGFGIHVEFPSNEPPMIGE